jgi:nicotinamidase/pyrazinamidase
LCGYLQERGFDRLTFVGLAFDYCVRYSAEDAKAQGFSVTVIERATRAIDLNGSAAATRASFAERGIVLA